MRVCSLLPYGNVQPASHVYPLAYYTAVHMITMCTHGSFTFHKYNNAFDIKCIIVLVKCK